MDAATGGFPRLAALYRDFALSTILGNSCRIAAPYALETGRGNYCPCPLPAAGRSDQRGLGPDVAGTCALASGTNRPWRCNCRVRPFRGRAESRYFFLAV